MTDFQPHWRPVMHRKYTYTISTLRDCSHSHGNRRCSRRKYWGGEGKAEVLRGNCALL